jgi:hypothetical protein
MADRSSCPHRCPNRLSRRTERRIVKLRATRRWGPARIANVEAMIELGYLEQDDGGIGYRFSSAAAFALGLTMSPTTAAQPWGATYLG